MCQASSQLDQAQQKLVVDQLTRRLAALQVEMQEWSHLFGHLSSPLTAPIHNAAEQLEAILNQLRQAEEVLIAHPHEHQHSHVTFVSK